METRRALATGSTQLNVTRWRLGRRCRSRRRRCSESSPPAVPHTPLCEPIRYARSHARAPMMRPPCKLGCDTG
eukprot:1126093-Prorocentrum_minimum.AAC.4